MQTRTMLKAGLATGIALLGLFAAVCSHTSPAIYKLERVTLGVRPEKSEDAIEENRRSRASEKRVLWDVRDAWTAPLGESFSVPIAAEGRASIFTAVSVTGLDPATPIPDVHVELELCWKAGGRADLTISTPLSLEQLARAWCPISLDLETANETRGEIVCSARVVGAPGAPGANGSDGGAAAAHEIANLRACWAVPSIRGYASPPFAPKRAAGPNILLISVDTLRADHLGCYGYERATSPSIDRIAERGVRFERAISSAPWTLPSYGSLFTSLSPGRHGAGLSRQREAAWGTPARIPKDQLKGPALPLCKDVPTLAERLRDEGWRTAAFTCNPFLNPVRGVDRGFMEYVCYQYNALAGVELAQKFMERNAGNRWFVFLHLIDPHYPYLPPAPFDKQFNERGLEGVEGYPPPMQALRASGTDAGGKQMLTDMYDGEIAFADDQIGRLLEALEKRGALDDILVLFHSDHGEEFWDHGGFEHGHAMYDEVLRIPLIFSWPGHVPAARRIATRVRTIDVFPTILELCGLPAMKGLEGASLVALMNGAAEMDRECLVESILWGEREIKVHIEGVDKLIAQGVDEDELFDLAQDPGETKNLAAEKPDRAHALRRTLAEHHAQTAKNPCVQGDATVKIDPVTQQHLNGLGYVDGAPPEDAHAPKPKKE